MSSRIVANTHGKGKLSRPSDLAEYLESLITSRYFEPGKPLPSLRELSKQLNISMSTTRRAFDLLRRRGLIDSVRGSRNFVRPDSESEITKFSDNELDRVSQNRTASLRTELKRAILNWAEVPDFASDTIFDPRGSYPLRFSLAESISMWLGPHSADDLLLTSNIEQARELLARILVDSKSTIMVVAGSENACEIERNYLSHGALVVTRDMPSFSADTIRNLNREGQNIKLLHLRFKLSELNLLSNENLQLELASLANDILVITEWDDLTEMREGEPGYPRALLNIFSTRDGVTAQIGSFSPAPNLGLEVGFVILPEHLKRDWSNTKFLADRHISSVVQQILSLLLTT